MTSSRTTTSIYIAARIRFKVVGLALLAKQLIVIFGSCLTENSFLKHISFRATSLISPVLKIFCPGHLILTSHTDVGKQGLLPFNSLAVKPLVLGEVHLPWLARELFGQRQSRPTAITTCRSRLSSGGSQHLSQHSGIFFQHNALIKPRK
jgi:hypothetical protein